MSSSAPVPNHALASFGEAGAFTDDPLLSDGHHVVTRKGTMPSGSGFVKRGTVLKYNPTDHTLSTTTGPFNAVLAENVDATAANQEAIFYVSGKMKADAIIWPASGARADIANQLRDYGIIIESVILRGGQSTTAVVAVTLAPTSAAPVEAGGAATIAVTMAETPGYWSVTKDASATWITIDSPTTPQNANGTINYTVAAQPAGPQPARSANLYVNGTTFTVTQAVGT